MCHPASNGDELAPARIGVGTLQCSTTPGLWRGKDFWNGDWLFVDRVGDLSNSELQGYTPSQASLDANGYLQIQAAVGASHGMAYTSAMLQWKRSLTFVHGTLEIRARMAGGQGPWPACWLLGKNCMNTNPTTADNGDGCNWPYAVDLSDEIDFIEYLGSQRQILNAQIHNESGNDGGGVDLGVDTSLAFHTYKLVRTTGVLRWYFDDTLVQTVNTHVSETPMGLILNLAVGGQGGVVNNATLPQSMLIDYVRLTATA